MEAFLNFNTLNFFALFMIVLLYFHAKYYFKRSDQKQWKQSLLVVMFAQTLDILSWYIQTKTGTTAIALSYVLNVALFTTSTFMAAQFALFLYEYIEGKTKKTSNLKRVFNSFTLFNFILLTLSVPFGWVFSIDNNNDYFRGPIYFVMMIVILLPVIIVLFKLLFKYVKNYNKLFSDNKSIIWLLGINVVLSALIIYLQGNVIKDLGVVFPLLTFSILFLHLLVISKAITIDYLTKIQNKFGLDLYFSQLPKISEHYIAAIFFDLDNFKQINDNYGHKEGDKLLIQFAEILSSEIKNKDIAARIGGDEFLIVLQVKEYAEIDLITNTIAEETQKLTIENHKVSYSFGVSVVEPNQILDKELLIEQADQKMYKNKFEKK